MEKNLTNNVEKYNGKIIAVTLKKGGLLVQRFRLSDSFLELYKTKKPNWGPIGEFVFMRTYSRKVDGENRNEQWWETVRRVVEGTFNIQKDHCARLRLPWKNPKAQRSAQIMYDKIFNFKFLPPGRGLWIMGTEFIETRGGASLNNPLHESTKVLTQEYGWIPIGKIEGEDVHVLSSEKLYARDNGFSSSAIWVEATISNFDEQECVEITFKSKFGDFTKIIASKNHRWFRRKNTKTEWERVASTELNIGDLVPRVKPPKNYKISYQGAQHGFFFGDGTRSNGELHQFKDSVAVLNKMFKNVVEIDEEHSVVRQCPIAWGYVPEGKYKIDKRYLYGFLAGYFAADGCMYENGLMEISSARLDELEVVKNLFGSLGIRTGNIILSSTSSNFKEERELYKLSIDINDVQEDFFLKEKHIEIYRNSFDKPRRRDWAKIIDIVPAGKHKVFCATVPYYEQFVIDGFILTSNCGFCSTEDIDIKGSFPFTFTMDALMLGVGIGFDTKGAGKITIQSPKNPNGSLEYKIPDSREGWVESIEMIIDAFFYGKQIPKFDYSLIRPYGSEIKGFGGVASGPGPLRDLHQNIAKLLTEKAGEQLTSVDIVDIMNMIGVCVVAGNVRRSAEIAIGDYKDVDYITMKDNKKNKKALMNWRWASNNSIFAEVGKTDYKKLVESIALNGEPGIVWLNNIRKYGRLNDPENWVDKHASGVNPCSEQSLESYELCCLVETFPSLHNTYEEYQETLKYAYLYAKTVALIPTHWEETNAVMMKNRRIGTSQSGIMDAFVKHGRRTMLDWCDRGYKYLRQLDETYSNWLCVPRSIKITSVKPSGSVSQLPGVSSGIHYPHSEYYIRRVRVASNSPLLEPMKKAGYPTEENKYGTEETKGNTVIISFPVHEKNFSRRKDDVTIWEQVKNAVDYQRYWADNNVSITVTFKDHEKEDIVRVLEAYEDQLKAISFLPIKDHGYEQAPYEEITKEQYEEMAKKVKPIDFSSIINTPEGEKYCTNDSCSL